MALLGVLIASGLAAFILGHFWYHPRLFGRVWMRLTNLSPMMAEQARTYHYRYAAIGFLGGSMVALGVSELRSLVILDISRALMLTLTLWFSCALPIFLGMYAWEQRPLRLIAVNAGYWLVVFMMVSFMVIVSGVAA